MILTSLELWSNDLVSDLNHRLNDRGFDEEAKYFGLSAHSLAAITQRLYL